MKIASIVARYLLGLLFTVFGLNGYFHFIHQPPPANLLALHFLGAVSATHFAAFFFAGQVVGGLLLLSGYEVAVANSRGPETLAPLAKEFGPSILPTSVASASAAEIIFLAVPFSAHKEIAA